MKNPFNDKFGRSVICFAHILLSRATAKFSFHFVLQNDKLWQNIYFAWLTKTGLRKCSSQFSNGKLWVHWEFAFEHATAMAKIELGSAVAHIVRSSVHMRHVPIASFMFEMESLGWEGANMSTRRKTMQRRISQNSQKVLSESWSATFGQLFVHLQMGDDKPVTQFDTMVLGRYAARYAHKTRSHKRQLFIVIIKTQTHMPAKCATICRMPNSINWTILKIIELQWNLIFVRTKEK